MALMTPAQYKRLPNLMKEIIEVDHNISAVVGHKVVSIREGSGLRDLMVRRKELTRHAERTWGNAKNTKGGPVHA